MALRVRQSRQGLSERLLGAVVGMSVAGLRYEPKLIDENEVIADWLERLTQTYCTWGFGLCYWHLRNVKRFPWNHKRVYRIYKQLELNLRIKPRRRIKRDKPQSLTAPTQVNQAWSMDFMSDNLSDGRSLRTFNVIDDHNREALTLEVGLSLTSGRVIRSLNQVIEERGKPASIRCDNGPEYISQSLKDWANEQSIKLDYIQPGKPTQNAYIERFNRTARQEWLNQHNFTSVAHAQATATQWMWVYNHERPHTALGGYPPKAVCVSPSTSN